jgi:hypothetical protein
MITVARIKDDEGFTQGFSIIIDTAESVKAFEELVQRGANLWPDAQPEIKEFADLITNGKILQKYREQAKDKINR